VSSFLPDNFGTTDKYTSYTTSDQTFNEADGHLLNRVFSRPQLIPNPFWSYLVDYIAVNQPAVPISQVIGFAQAVPPGMIVDYGGTTPPGGWLLCDGATVGRTTYKALFAAIGVLYGAGDGSTTFALPDFRGRTSVGHAPSGGHTDVSTLGNNDGAAITYRRPKHRHTGHSHSSGTGTIYASNATGATDDTVAKGSTANVPSITVTSVSVPSADGGSGTATDPLDAPAYLVVTRIIKV
jgi:microcystin-dependent protein